MACYLAAPPTHARSTGTALGTGLHAAVACATLLACLPPIAHAEGTDVFTVNAAASLVQDSNLFRLPDDANLPALIGSNSASDQITITSLGIKADKAYSLQRFELDLSLANYRYQSFSYLNNTANNSSAAWRWSVTPRVRGNLTTDRKETLNDFADTSSFKQRNQRVILINRLDGGVELDGAWRVLAGAAETNYTNTQNQSADADSLTRAADISLQYVFASGSQWTYTVRTAKGNYQRAASQTSGPIDDGFDQADNEVSARWMMGGRSVANLRVTAFERSHPLFSQRNFSGTNVSAGLLYQLTGKTSVNLGFSRALSSYQTNISNYTQTDRISIAPNWQISARTLLRLGYSNAQRSYLGSPNALPQTVRQRTEQLTDTSLSLEWQPQPQLTLSASVQDSRRSTNFASLDYQSMSSTVSATLSF